MFLPKAQVGFRQIRKLFISYDELMWLIYDDEIFCGVTMRTTWP